MKKPELSRNQTKALAALLSHPSVATAAQACGLSERTLFNYLADQDFKAELRRRQGKILAATTAALVGLSSQAVETLLEVMNDPGATPATRRKAAQSWLYQARQAVTLTDLADRVEALEEKLEAR